MKYTAFNGNAIPEDELGAVENLVYTDTTTSNKYGHWLPQIHLKIKPLDWLDIRLAYTNTLSRPDYSDLAPRMQISHNSKTVRHSGTYLLPARSENFDLILSLHREKFGLLTFRCFS